MFIEKAINKILNYLNLMVDFSNIVEMVNEKYCGIFLVEFNIFKFTTNFNKIWSQLRVTRIKGSSAELPKIKFR